MYKNLSEIAAHKKWLRSEIVVPKIHFLFVVYCVLSQGTDFFQSKVFLEFMKVVAGIHYLMDTLLLFILEEHLQAWIFYVLCICIFDRYFSWTHIVISKEHLQPYIWMVPSLFQEVFCSDLVFSRVLCFFEISTCNHSCFQRCWVNPPFQLQPFIRQMALSLLQKSSCSHTFFQIYCIFFQNRRSCSKEIS